MALMTGEQYIESIRKIPMEIYMFGKKVENPVDNPILRPSLNSVRMTYDLAQMPEYQELMTAISPETGERINRFTYTLGRALNALARLLNRTILHRHPMRTDFEYVLDASFREVSSGIRSMSVSISFGLLLLCIGLYVTCLYLLQ